ncbi:MAG TPA: PepSY-like domain-containing protein [Puia sp.]|nr:PepSY-like domain-containing protein [Puia sp.]
MKKIMVLLLSASFVTASAFAKIPSKVDNAFHARYSKVSDVKWSHGLGDYKASFYMGDYQYKAKFDKQGNWKESEKIIGKDRLPVMVKNSFKRSKYGEWNVKSSYEKYTPNEKPKYHITAAKGDFKRKTLMFDHHGQLMNG